MEEVHDAVARSPQPEPAFPLLQFNELYPQLRETSRVVTRPPLIGRYAYERLWAIINRALRRLAGPAVDPAIVQQNEWNAVALETLSDLAAIQAALQAEVSRLDAERLPHDPI